MRRIKHRMPCDMSTLGRGARGSAACIVAIHATKGIIILDHESYP